MFNSGRSRIKGIFLAFLTLKLGMVSAQNSLYVPVPAWEVLAGENWTGVERRPEGLLLSLPGKAVYKVPEGGRGWYQRGLMSEYDGVIDARQWYGIRMDIQLDRDELFEGKLVIRIPGQRGRQNLPDSATAEIKVQGRGWRQVILPFSVFDYNRGQTYFLKFFKQLSFTGGYKGITGGAQAIKLRNIKLLKGNPLSLDAVIRSKPGDADSVVNYTVAVTNSSDSTQHITFSLCRSGWEGMAAHVTPEYMILQPGETKPLQVDVRVPALAPPGSQEAQHLVASTPEGVTETLDLITVRRLKAPYLVFTEDGWNAVLDKVKRYAWAKAAAEEYIKKADAFEVPVTPPGNIRLDNATPAVFKMYLERQFWPVAVAYKLTGDKKYAEKLGLLLRRLSAPGAYPGTLHANTGDIPQEGGFWEGIARCYDLVRDAGVLSETDKSQIEQSLRLYIYTIEDGLGNGGISNWSLFNLCPAAQCALALQDMVHFNLLMDGSCGIKDHLKYGMLDDGWWYEMSLSYNLGCAENITSLGLAARPFGIDFLNEHIPVALTRKVGLRPFEFESFEGMAFGKFGPVRNNFVTPRRMWDAIVIYPDYRGVLFGMGDGHEEEISGGVFEMAYYAYRDSAYAAVIKQGRERDLLYGVPELPEGTPTLYTRSGHSDDAGIAVLRSQTEGREQKEQIQAAFKYGTHGSYHGHFDRLSLLSLMRYGRSFYNPETSWFGYPSYMYKWWVQPSMSHNMVVVDGKQQEPQECTPLLFYSGRMMQVCGAVTNARWSNPPYFGGYDQLEKVRDAELPYVPIPADPPQPAEVTAYTEPVLQKRLLIVTDDYVVTADYLKGAGEHDFDNLLQLRGAVAGPNMKYTGHDGQFDVSPLSSGQFITNVDHYAGEGTVPVTSLMRTGEGDNLETGGQKSHSVPGDLHIDAYNAWPHGAELRIGNYAESWPISKKLKYEVTGDGKMLATDSLGAWILGKGELIVNVKGIKRLQLKTYTRHGGNTLNTLFWANARLVTAGGKNIFLSSIPVTMENILPVKEKGKDYEGGGVQIAGMRYAETLPAEPAETTLPATISVDISGLNAIRLEAIVGGDYPVGKEDQLRKTVSFHSRGRSMSFLTVIEPYEKEKSVKSVMSVNAGTLNVELNDGRTQKILIRNLDTAAGKLSVSIREYKDGRLVREETTPVE